MMSNIRLVIKILSHFIPILMLIMTLIPTYDYITWTGS